MPSQPLHHPAARDFEDFLEYLAEQGKAKATIVAYRHSLRRLLKMFPEKNFRDFGYDDLMAFIETLPERDRGQRSTPLRRWFKWGVVTNRIDDDPARLIPTFKWPRYGPIQDVFSETEIAALESLPEPDGTLMAVMFGTGIARGEAQSLKASQFDLDNWHLQITNPSKGTLPRTIPLEDPLVRRLPRFFRSFDIRGDDHLWATRPGGGRIKRDRPISQASFAGWWKDCLAEAGVTNYRPPSKARHTCAVRWRNRGKRLDDIQLFLGHNSYYTTEQYYAPIRFHDAEQRFRQDLPDDVAEDIRAYEWRIGYAENPDGSFTVILLNKEGAALKFARGDDFHDALLEAWKDVYPPSDEVLRHQPPDN